MLRKDKLLGGVLGLAVGDALGVPVEFVQREVLKSSPVESMEGYGSHNQPVGTWSDDTSMVLATLDSMCRGFSTDGMMEAFSRCITWQSIRLLERCLILEVLPD